MSSDLFPGFASRHLRGAGAHVFARVGGHGPPLLLLHGYPQTHVCWHRVAPILAVDYTLVICDLRGYGRSGIPAEQPQSTEFAKREMAFDLVAAMQELGFERYFVAGHDRGARVAYRMALDSPERVAALAVLAILPTFAMWSRMHSNEYAMQAFRWFFLAQPFPLPELLITAAGKSYLFATLTAWTKTKDLSAFDARALEEYERAHASASTIAASCGDYRAGWTADRFHDQADLDAGRKIRCPTIALWGSAEFPPDTPMGEEWARIAADLKLKSLDCGHFLPEEAPNDVADNLKQFFGP